MPAATKPQWCSPPGDRHEPPSTDTAGHAARSGLEQPCFNTLRSLVTMLDDAGGLQSISDQSSSSEPEPRSLTWSDHMPLAGVGGVAPASSCEIEMRACVGRSITDESSSLPCALIPKVASHPGKFSLSHQPTQPEPNSGRGESTWKSSKITLSSGRRSP